MSFPPPLKARVLGFTAHEAGLMIRVGTTVGYRVELDKHGDEVQIVTIVPTGSSTPLDVENVVLIEKDWIYGIDEIVKAHFNLVKVVAKDAVLA